MMLTRTRVNRTRAGMMVSVTGAEQRRRQTLGAQHEQARGTRGHESRRHVRAQQQGEQNGPQRESRYSSRKDPHGTRNMPEPGALGQRRRMAQAAR